MRLFKIDVDKNLMATILHGTSEFPMQIYTDEFIKYNLGIINWHWHKEIEFSVVLKGSVQYFVGNDYRVLKEGEGIFINSNLLHMSRPLDKTKSALMFSVVINSVLIAPLGHNAIYEKYVSPILYNSNFPYLILSRENNWQRIILEMLSEMYSYEFRTDFGYEMKLRNILCDIWYILINNSVESLRKGVSSANSLNELRVKKMIFFIQEHFSEAVTVDKIAAVASVSKSECYRCFKSTIHMSPIDYLLQYRINHATQLLLNTNKLVSEICFSCGFNNASYFAKKFKQKTGLSPNMYRKNFILSSFK